MWAALGIKHKSLCFQEGVFVTEPLSPRSLGRDVKKEIGDLEGLQSGSGHCVVWPAPTSINPTCRVCAYFLLSEQIRAKRSTVPEGLCGCMLVWVLKMIPVSQVVKLASIELLELFLWPWFCRGLPRRARLFPSTPKIDHNFLRCLWRKYLHSSIALTWKKIPNQLPFGLFQPTCPLNSLSVWSSCLPALSSCYPRLIFCCSLKDLTCKCCFCVIFYQMRWCMSLITPWYIMGVDCLDACNASNSKGVWWMLTVSSWCCCHRNFKRY